MKGYHILEEQFLKEYREDGINPHETRIGFLDFLRELKGGVEGIPNCSSFMVVGIDEVLYQTDGRARQELALAIHKILQSAAKKLDQKMIEVQIVCRGKLIKGDSLWLDYRGEKLPIDYIFGTPAKQEIRSLPTYMTGFNLSS